MAQPTIARKTLHTYMKAKTRNARTEYLSILKKTSLAFTEKKLHRAVSTNNTELLEQLLQSGVSPNASDSLLRSPLHLAASRGYKDVVNILIAHGADPNQRDIIGNTALHLAACTNNLEIVTILLDAGTDVASLDVLGRNPLQLAQSKLKLIQKHRESTVEMINIRVQLQHVINLMLSFLRRQESNQSVEKLEIMKLKLDESSDAQIEDQVSNLLTAIEDISIQ